MKILRLTLKKKWFDMILSGEKKEEYREMKPYWIVRFKKRYDAILFVNGYAKDARRFTIDLQRIRVWYGRKEWGGNPDQEVFVLDLGDIIK